MTQEERDEKIELYKRQLDLLDLDRMDMSVVVIGAGGIGSWSSFLLAQCGFNKIKVFDDDVVELHNTASQFYKQDQLGMPKVEALKANIKEQTGVEISIRNSFFIDLDAEVLESLGVKLVVITVDSMAERIKLNEMLKDKDVYIIDGRMGGLQGEVYCMPAHRYHETLVDPENIDPEPCTGRSISFNCAGIGSFITNFARELSMGKLEDQEIIISYELNQLFKSIK